MIQDLPPIVKRVRDTLSSPALPKDYPALLDLGKTLADQWTLHLTNGLYHFYGAQREVESASIHIDKKEYKELTDYSIFYNPKTGLYNVQEGSYDELMKSNKCISGHHVGGFMYKGCKLSFALPQNECIRYARSFSKEFNQSYQIEKEFIDICNKYCSEFNFEYNNEFEVSCKFDIKDKLDCKTEYSIFKWFSVSAPVDCKITKP